MNHGSLFSGIGGFDLAAEWMGWTNKFHCEWNPFGQKVLKYYWPEAESYSDITKTDFSIWRGRIDILTGAFPCQPYSTAGKRLGKEDERHLWPEMLRAIREIQPRYVVGENVSGLVNWNVGMVFEEVQAELEAEGYKVRPFILPASGVGMPHGRERVFFIAYSKRNRLQRKLRQNSIYKNEPFKAFFTRKKKQVGDILNNWEKFFSKSKTNEFNDGFSTRLDGITFPKWRTESIKAYGNAIVPQVAFQIFKAIEQFEQLNNDKETT